MFQIRFPAMEKLWLDDNKLMDQSTFSTLAGLRRQATLLVQKTRSMLCRVCVCVCVYVQYTAMCTEIEKSEVNSSQLACPHRLRYLNLDNNEIYTIPQLKLIGTSPLKVTTDKHILA